MWCWLAAVALAGKVYVNGVDVTGLQGQTFEDVTVTFDQNGDIRVVAPGYEIQVVDPATVPSAGEPVERPVRAGGLAETAPPSPTTTPDPAPPMQSGLPEGRWWLVTEDDASKGHEVEVFVNDQLVRTVRSGEPQVIEDVGPWLRRGRNEVRMVSTSDAGGGGTLYIYMGTGNNDSGTLMMDAPDIQFGLGGGRTGTYEREYTIEVPQ